MPPFFFSMTPRPIKTSFFVTLPSPLRSFIAYPFRFSKHSHQAAISFPVDALGTFLLLRRGRTLRHGRSASRIAFTFLTLLASARFACLTVNPALPVILGKPFTQ
jgi:hypothetical protein